MSKDEAFSHEVFSPQVQRLLELADLERRRNLNGRGDRTICPEHLLVALVQDADPGSAAYGLLSAAGLSIADIRAGKVEPKPQKA